MDQLLKIFAVVAIISLPLSGCQSEETDSDSGSDSDFVWAVNIGGASYEGVDGTVYEADNSVSGGTVGETKIVKGSQDPTLYRTYREGDIEIARAIPIGVYDITFHFAEPRDYGKGDRLLTAFVNGTPVIENLDVMLSRDGKVDSALTVTIPAIPIEDGELNINFVAAAGEPILNALVVQEQLPREEDWKLVWSDEFDYTGPPDPAKWAINVWPARKVNDEDQAYTAREKNLRVENGHLIIEAFKEQYDNAEYTSGRVYTKGKDDFLYGRFEVRAKLPAGKGTWPAIWMLPNNPFKYATTCEPGEDWQGSAICDAWPNSGEIDIMEHVGYEMGHVHGTVHNEAYYWAKWEQRKGRILIDDVADAFHTYALEWTPEEIQVFVDDHLYFVYVNENNGWQTWPYDQPFNLILNIAVGGMWGRSGGGIDDSIFPQRMEVDFVRVYQREASVAAD
ncbi:MAG: family 16 glycosylhydrolase [Woeseia sp.]|nr:family 16 glycosylhydrolase [Woeseia sp.]